MGTTRILASIAAAALLTGSILAALTNEATAQTVANDSVALDADDIGGIVRGARGPEAGVWVIAETTDLPTRFARIVVTDDRGRYVIPDLPPANYRIWVRGYGLVDSPKLRGKPGDRLDHTAVAAPDERSAAHYYPAIYWYAMLKVPTADQFGKGDFPAKLTQTDYLKQIKNIGCIGCHQLGQESTRTLPAGIGTHKSSQEAWIRRIQSGQYGEGMVNQLGRWNMTPLRYYAEWTDRIGKGELPFAKPPRPAGEERNIVVSWWEWSSPKKYLHDLISSDRRNPTVNAYGPLWGQPEYSTDDLPVLDPRTHKVWTYRAPVRDPAMPESLGPGHAASAKLLEPSPYYGAEKLWDTRANNHNSMFDQDGRLWHAASIRGMSNPDFCSKGSSHPSAKLTPLDKSARHLAVYDPKTNKYTFVDTCFSTHHLQFGYDADNTLWTSGGRSVAGWLNTRKFLATGDAAQSQGWTAFVRDSNGNGRRDPDDKTIAVGSGPYAVMPHRTDGSVWFTVGTFGGTPGFLRLAPGKSPPETALSEFYAVPKPGFGIRGGDIDSKGVLWASTSSGHLASFDRARCKAPLAGPAADGNHCPEGWSFHQYPGPGFQGLGENSAESSYYTWVDQHDTFGLGNDIPMSTGNLNDGLIAMKKDGRMIVLRIPYPLGSYFKGFDGRIDDPGAGWKGRGLWTASGDRTPWLKEGGKGTRPLAVQFQLRSNPLAK